MNKALNPIKKRYLKRVNPAYTYFTKLELQEELYKVLKSNEELTWFIGKLSQEPESV